MENLNLDNLDKEQSFFAGLLFGISISGNKQTTVEVKKLPRDKILNLCREMNLNVNDTHFYLDFISHNCNRFDLARRYGYCDSAIYPKFRTLNTKIQNYYNNSHKFIDLL